MSDVTRRNMIKTGLLGAGAITAMAAAKPFEAKAAEVPVTPGLKEEEYDAVIIGSGCAGMVCAIQAAELGLKPVIIEKMAKPAGNTVYAGGHLLGLHTRFQKEQNINMDDTEEKYYEDMMKMSQGKGDPTMTRFFVKNCSTALEWLADKCGVEYGKLEVEPYPARGRGHVVVGELKPGGAQLSKNLLDTVKAKNIPVMFNTKAVELVVNDKMAVTGVKIVGEKGTQILKGRYGVVLATGGFHASEDLVTQYMGGWAAQMPNRGSRIIMGENLALTKPLFTKMVNIDQFHAGPIYGPTGANPSIMVNYGILVRPDGTRYMDEVSTYVRVAKETPKLTKDNWAFIIVDAEPKETSAMVQERFARYERTKTPIYSGSTIEELAKNANIDVKTLVSTVNEYNKAVKSKKTGQLNPPNTLEAPRNIIKPPFYAVPFQGGITATFGGPLVNVKTEVQNGEGNPIRGLYAIGNSIGGLFYDDYIVGAQLTSATVYGLVCAGELFKNKRRG